MWEFRAKKTKYLGSRNLLEKLKFPRKEERRKGKRNGREGKGKEGKEMKEKKRDIMRLYLGKEEESV